MVHIEYVTIGNIRRVCNLEVFEDQQDFIASNMKSIATAYLAITKKGCYAYPFAIYNNFRVVGFLMIGYNEIALERNAPKCYTNNYTIWRLMVDKKYQNNGYGTDAIDCAIHFIKTWPSGKADLVAVAYKPENVVANKIFARYGFTLNGEMDGDKVVAVLKL